MCGLFGSHKNHKMSTSSELRKLNENIIEKGKEFLDQSIDVDRLRDCESYSEYLQGQGRTKIKMYKSTAQRVYDVS